MLTLHMEYDDYYKILPQINDWGRDKARIKNGKLVESDFSYSSDKNEVWLSHKELKAWLNANISH